MEILRGPNIKPFPKTAPLPDSIEAKALLKVGDNITTDHIMPAGAKILPLPLQHPLPFRSTASRVCDPDFPGPLQGGGQAASSSAAPTTDRAAPGSTPPWRPCTWASRPSS